MLSLAAISPATTALLLVVPVVPILMLSAPILTILVVPGIVLSVTVPGSISLGSTTFATTLWALGRGIIATVLLVLVSTFPLSGLATWFLVGL